MPRKQENNVSKNNMEKQDVHIEEQAAELNDNNIVKEEIDIPIEEVIVGVEQENAVEAAIKEYNGEVKQENIEERRIKIREGAEVAKPKKTNKKLIAIVSSIIFAIIISAVALAVVNKMNSNVYKNIYLNGKNLSGMTTSELTDYLRGEQEKLTEISLKILQGNEKILEVMPSDIDFKIDVEAVEEQIFGYGRNSNIFKNNLDILYALILKKDFDLVYKYDMNKLSDIVKEIKESLDNKVTEDSYIVDEKEYKLIITRGKSGKTIEENHVKNKIIEGLANNLEEYVVDTVNGKPTPIDVDVLYSKVKRKAKDAYIDKSTTIYKFVPHQVGLDFDKEDLQAVLAKEENMQEGKVVEYKLTVVEPEVKTSDIKWDLYEYQISSYTTYFSTNDANRVNNLRVALNLLNGKVIMPGETFSYNAVVGGATKEQGFKPAATFAGGRVVSEVGGGICQTVSTLYNTALLANLEIVQRKAHSLPVAYVKGSRDATVYHPSIDFKFKNTREFPVKIVTSFNKNGSLTISLYGTKEEKEYVISIEAKTLSTIPYKIEYQNDSNMEKGKQQVIQNGSNGYKSEAYIIKKLNGKVVSKELLSRDTYKAVNKIVKVGTKVVAPPAVEVKPENPGGNTTETKPGDNTTTETPETPTPEHSNEQP